MVYLQPANLCPFAFRFAFLFTFRFAFRFAFRFSGLGRQTPDLSCGGQTGSLEAMKTLPEKATAAGPDPVASLPHAAEKSGGKAGGKAGEKSGEKSGGKLTPMMAQFLAVKSDYPDALLFYRMGDFYEMFFEDAEQAAAALGIALTKRGQIEGRDVPMCGVPVHALDSYLPRLIKQGFRVAICEQSIDPESFKKQGGKGPLPRAVVRVVTAGTLNEDGLLHPQQNNYLAAIGRAAGGLAIAWADMSTAAFFVEETKPENLSALLARLAAAEIILPDSLSSQEAVQKAEQEQDSPFLALPARDFDSQQAEARLLRFYQLQSLSGLGQFSRAMLSAAGGLLAYLERTQLDAMPRLAPLRALTAGQIMEIDPATRRSLEITRTLDGSRAGSLLAAVDFTATASGARLLADRLSAPLCDKPAIEARLDLASWFTEQESACEAVREKLASLPDMERSLSRLAQNRGGPRDLAALVQALSLARQMAAILDMADQLALPDGLAQLTANLLLPADLIEKLEPALADELPLLAREGGFVRAGYDAQLDKLRTLRDESRRLIAGLQGQYCDLTGISSLKIKHNNVLGYHIEVRANHGDKLFSDDRFIHRQTTAQAVRFTTPELSEMERDLSSAAQRALAVEAEIFERLTTTVLEQAAALASCSEALAQLDIAAATARLASRHHCQRPQITDGLDFDIVSGRHLVVERALSADQSFIANDCQLPEEANLWLLTGPNMAGKSTFLRQNAHIVILAQAGLFVPAEQARIGVADRLFSRVGASDDLARGQSTFMVEMVETAAILNQATRKSLVILDEIGRGTATYDGLAIACATLEWLHNENGCRTLFATHYHELTAMQSSLQRLRTHTMLVREWDGQIVFLHQLGPGVADRSYGVHVARLAGLPDQVIGRASQLLELLEAGKQGQLEMADLSASLPLFQAAPPAPAKIAPPPPDALDTLLEGLDPDALSPKQALDLLYQIKQASQARKKS